MHSVKTLRATVHDLTSLLKRKDQEITSLKAQLVDKEAQRKQLLSYLYKPGKDEAEKSKPRGKQRGAPAYHRPQPHDNEVTETNTFPLSICPTCNHSLGASAETIIRYEEDIDLAPRKIIKKYVIPRYWCPRCKDIVKSSRVPLIQRIGPHVMGYILYARYKLRLPMDAIKASLLDLHNFSISEGEIAEKLKEAEELFAKDYDALAALIQTARVVYADETGWRMDGDNWWLWVFTTEKGVRYMLEMSRGKGVAEEALGKKKNRVIVSDGYAVYGTLSGENQQCWVHLLRTAKFASPLLYQDLISVYVRLGEELTKFLKERDPPLFEKELHTIIQKQYREDQAKKVQERIKHHLPRLLTCLKHEGVLPENNTAERALRNHVVMRKIFGGSRSPDGARVHEVNTSVLETLKKQNPDIPFFGAVLPLLKKRIEEHHSVL